MRPLRLGLSVGHISGTCGSIGPFVTDAAGKVGFLSTATVLAPPKARPGDFIHQPSAVDFDLTGASRAGELSTHIARNQPGDSDPADAAIAWLLDPQPGPLNVIPPELPDAGRRITSDGEKLRSGDLVATVGRTTGPSQGVVEVLDVTIPVRLGTGTAEFRGCIAVRSPHGAFTQPGDAGALVWRVQDAMALGIVFAADIGSQDSRPTTFILPLAPILARFGLRLA